MATIEERIEKLEAELTQLKRDALPPAGFSDLLTIEEAKKLPINTPILVATCLNATNWLTGHFGGISDDGQFLIYKFGRTLYSNDGEAATNKFPYAKRDYTAPSILNWIPNTGVQPTIKEGAKAVGRLRDGSLCLAIRRWSLIGDSRDVIEYFIIE